MNKLIISIIAILIIAAGIGAYFVFQKPTIPEPQADTPYYFIAIHNEPYHVPGGEKKLAEEYNTLKRMIAKADQYNIKLTLMFTAQWADYISGSPERLKELESWKKQGHEIAGHHHSIYHGNWDGYTDYSKEEAYAQRTKQGFKPEEYLGTLSDYINKLKKLNPNIKSCCCNEEHDKKEMPNEMIYATCSGFANYGEVGTRLSDTDQKKGKNEYILIGIANNILRKWLAHYQITTPERQKLAQTVFDSTNPSYVYGVVTHSASGVQEEEYYNFLEFLHSRDPEGKKSRTVSKIIKQKLLPEKTISADLLNQKIPVIAKPWQPADKLGRCSDGVCDSHEQANPSLCPKDCGFLIDSERCGAENNGYCIDWKEKCKEGYEGIGPDKCKRGKLAQCCMPTTLSEPKTCEDLCGDGICQEIVCMAIGCPCPETPQTCPSDCKEEDSISPTPPTTLTNEDSAFGIAFPRDNEMDELKDLNIGIVRVAVGFDRQWKIDGLVNLLHENNISTLMTIHQAHHKDTEYIDFVRNAVRRYRDKVDYWQIGNEVEGSFSPQEYASFVKKVSPIIRENDPGAKVVLGGMIYARGTMETLNSFFKPVLIKLEPGDFDIFDFHFFGQADGDYKKIADYANAIKALLEENNMNADIQVTEMATYSGSPTNESLQTEKEQAEDLIKRYIISFSSDVKKVFWVTITEWYRFGGKPNGYFDNVGFVNNPQQDSQNHKKLSYYTYKLMVEKLEGSNSVQKLQESDNVYIYKFTKNNQPVWVAWTDNSAEKQITISSITSSQVKITEAIPKYESGKDVADYDTAFETKTKTVQDGKIPIILNESPIFVEEK